MDVSKNGISFHMLDPPRSSDNHVTSRPCARPDKLVALPKDGSFQVFVHSLLTNKKTEFDAGDACNLSTSMGSIRLGQSSSQGFASRTSSDRETNWSNVIPSNNLFLWDSFPRSHVNSGPTFQRMPPLSCTSNALKSGDSMNTGNESRLPVVRNSFSDLSIEKFLERNEWNFNELRGRLEGHPIYLPFSHSSSGSTPPNNHCFEQSMNETGRRPFLDTLPLERSCSSHVPVEKRRIVEPLKPPAPLHVEDDSVEIFQTRAKIRADILSLMEQNMTMATELKRTPKKRRARRHAKEPANKEYVDEPTKFDVLFGRGTGPRLHSGNQRYYKKVGELRDQYRKRTDSEKLEVARQLIMFVKESGGRFLRQDEAECYYVVPEPGALTKARQALREHKFPHERK